MSEPIITEDQTKLDENSFGVVLCPDMDAHFIREQVIEFNDRNSSCRTYDEVPILMLSKSFKKSRNVIFLVDNLSKSIVCPKTRVGHVIGRQGKNIRWLEEHLGYRPKIIKI